MSWLALRALAIAVSFVSGIWVNTWDGMGASTPQNGGDPIAVAVMVGAGCLLFWLLDEVGL